MTLLTSFAATTITREGKSFPITKNIPVSAQKQIYAKVVFYLMVEIPVVVFSTLALHLAGFITLLDLFAIFVMTCLVLYGSICFAIYDDVKHPQFHLLTNNVAVQNNANIIRNVYSGLTIAIILGVCSVFLVLMADKWLWFGAVSLLAFVYMMIAQLRLSNNLEKLYGQIEA